MQHLNMEIELLESVAGIYFSFASGEIVEVSPELGRSLINAGQAKLTLKNTEVNNTIQQEEIIPQEGVIEPVQQEEIISQEEVPTQEVVSVSEEQLIQEIEPIEKAVSEQVEPVAEISEEVPQETIETDVKPKNIKSKS